MKLSRIIYHSEVNPAAPLDLRQLLNTAHRNNERAGLTGFLFFNDTYFIQVIEGERATLSALYHRIASDARHRNVTLIGCADIDERAFPAWLMGLRHGMSGQTRDIFMSTLGTGVFDPTTVSADETLDLLQLIALDVLAEVAA
jgi:Sensors of blue-light using FAD